MANNLTIRIVSKNPKAIIDKLINKETEEVDYNQVIPSPNVQDLDIGYGSFTYALMDSTSDLFHKAQGLLEKHYTKDIAQNEFTNLCLENKEVVDTLVELLQLNESFKALNVHLSQYIKGYFNYERYGYTDSRDFSLRNWNAYGNGRYTYVDDKTGLIEFQNSWTLPTPVIKELAKIAPVRVVYADDGIYTNSGIEDYYLNEYGDVECTTIMEGSNELALVINGYEDDEWLTDIEETDEEYKKCKDTLDKLSVEVETLMSDTDNIGEV